MKSLDKDILTSLAMLRRHINSLQSPIYRLPPDVFSEIATHLLSEADLVRSTLVSYGLRAALPSAMLMVLYRHKTRGAGTSALRKVKAGSASSQSRQR